MKSTRTKSVKPEPVVKNTNPKKYLLVVLSIIVILAVAALYFFLPNWFLNTSFAKFKTYNSLRIQYLPPVPDVFKFEALIHTNQTDLSKFILEINSINNEKDNSLAINLLSSKTDQYLNLNYSKIKNLEDEITKTYPPILDLQTYQRALPVIQGKSYLHLSSSDLEPFTKNKEVATVKPSQDTQDKLAKASQSIYILRSFNPFYQYQGQRYVKIVYGLDKNKLLDIIKIIKDSDLDIKVSQLNAIKKAIEDTPGWNNDLIEVLIDSHQNLYRVTLRLPHISDDVVSENLANSLSDQKNFEYLTERINAYVKNKVNKNNSDKPKLTELGSLTFDQLNSVEKFEKPNSVVESKSILEVAETELKPLAVSLLTGQPLALPTVTKKAVTPVVAKSPRPANCLIYQITNGPFASKKCYTPADAQALSKLVEQRNNVVANNKVAFETAQNRCNNGDQDACKQAENIYNSATGQISSLEQQIKAIIKRGW